MYYFIFFLFLTFLKYFYLSYLHLLMTIFFFKLLVIFKHFNQFVIFFNSLLLRINKTKNHLLYFLLVCYLYFMVFIIFLNAYYKFIFIVIYFIYFNDTQNSYSINNTFITFLISNLN